MTVRVLIVDDHPIVRSGLHALLSGGGEDIEPVGEACDGVAALEAVRELRPDVVLMDLGLPRLSGVEATRRLSAQSGGPRILVLTMSDDDASMVAAIRAGAHGYLLKDAGADEVLAAVRAVARGEAVFGRGVAPNVLDLLRGQSRPAPPAFPQLTARERAILDLVARGVGNQAIAQRLAVSTKTVANTLSGILVKIGVRDRGEAVELARQAGLGG